MHTGYHRSARLLRIPRAPIGLEALPAVRVSLEYRPNFDDVYLCALAEFEGNDPVIELLNDHYYHAQNELVDLIEALRLVREFVA